MIRTTRSNLALGAQTAAPTPPLSLNDAAALSFRDVSASLLSPISAAEVSKTAHAFMKKSGVIQPGEEAKVSFARSFWAAEKVVRLGTQDFVVMNLKTQSKDGDTWLEPEAGNAFEVIALTTSKSGKHSYRRFEESVAVPASLKVAIGATTPDFIDGPGGTTIPSKTLPTDLYYAQLRGPSALAALKSALTHTPVAGFSADLEGKGKTPFDPTVGRSWRVKNAGFDLRRGSTVEIYDVRPNQLDGDFAAYFEGSAGHVAPWTASRVRQIQLGKQWIDVVPTRVQSSTVASAPRDEFISR